MSVYDQQRLRKGAAELGVELAEMQEQGLLKYLALLHKWNKVYALISRREGDDWVARHLLDSLAVLPYINGSRVIDVGSGAGLPGIPLALMCPERQFTLLDSNNKKTRFMTQAVIELGLKNVEVKHCRVEQLAAEAPFDTVISRAFATISDMLAVAGQLAGTDGKYLAMKGVFPEEELAALPPGYHAEVVHALQVPFEEGDRHLAVVVADAAAVQ